MLKVSRCYLPLFLSCRDIPGGCRICPLPPPQRLTSLSTRNCSRVMINEQDHVAAQTLTISSQLPASCVRLRHWQTRWPTDRPQSPRWAAGTNQKPVGILLSTTGVHANCCVALRYEPYTVPCPQNNGQQTFSPSSHSWHALALAGLVNWGLPPTSSEMFQICSSVFRNSLTIGL